MFLVLRDRTCQGQYAVAKGDMLSPYIALTF